ncbi:MAG: 30S ribosomal protein S12 methylthiotransferase RimO, partial [Bacteroidetes bacterium]|nr:30S ribosomal protein S12 methylthiotransferase RimO [Bacteroidota bacterium]
DLINRIRDEVPGIAIRTTMLVGHPGETEADHHELLQFIESARFERLGVFTYSHEENTHAGNVFQDDLSDEVKERRFDEIMEIQQDISFEHNRKLVGQSLKVIVDKQENDYFVGRTEFDSPEVDNEVIIYSDQALKTGDFVEITISDAMEYDLIGKTKV